jgi:hypothetical protein
MSPAARPSCLSFLFFASRPSLRLLLAPERWLSLNNALKTTRRLYEHTIGFIRTAEDYLSRLLFAASGAVVVFLLHCCFRRVKILAPNKADNVRTSEVI